MKVTVQDSMEKLVICGVISLILMGCASEVTGSNCQISSRDLLSQIDTRELMNGLVEGLCPPRSASTSSLQNQDVLIVPDVVDVHSLQPDRLGVALGEILRASIFKICQIPIRQVELSREFRLSSDGLMALSRNPKEVRQPAFQASTAIIGTYHIDGSKLILVGRRVDIESSTYLAVTTKEISLTCESSYSGQKKMIYKIS